MKQLFSLLIGVLSIGGPMKIGASGAAVRAERDFIQREGDRKDAKWYTTSEGFIAEFDQGGRDGKYYYDRKGNWCYSVLTFGEKGLPEDLWRMVRSTYFEYSISWVKQVSGLEGSSYVVHIDNPAEWKELIVRDGEIVIWKAFEK